MHQPWLTMNDWPVIALDGNAAQNSVASATSSTVVYAAFSRPVDPAT
jgi:hypothetical protein